jgi:thioredoxin-dependent peroxiredoxin
MADIPLLREGSEAPPFSYRDADGRTLDTGDLCGGPFVVYFYPKDDTPGCTQEACGFRDSYEEFAAAGVPVIGVSPDEDESHTKFRRKHNLPFGLASDTDHTIAEAYGVWGEKVFMGRRYHGVHRVTYVVNADGRIAKVYPKVKPAEHARQILSDLPALSGPQ